jgi:phosphatidylserine/phosphatidylglycerophosphate/cardiolipin synthase-like enzyme
VVAPFVAALMAAVVFGTGAQTAPAGAATSPTPPTAAPYVVHKGAAFNSAYGRSRFTINNKIIAAIDHSRRGSVIRIMSWNVMSREATTHMLRAQNRGVTVRVLMDATNWSTDVPNPQFARLKRGLRAGNKTKSADGVSVAKVCQSSCRGKSGSAHSKYYLFAHVGSSRNVVMEGSANLTLAAATNQWNDIFTWVGNDTIYHFAVGIFQEMWKDQPVAAPWQQVTAGPFTLAFSPAQGADFTSLPVTDALSQVKCTGATNGNARHHTVIRLFPDVMRGARGLQNARQIRTLWNAGCDVEVGYTVLSHQAYKVFRTPGARGRVPLRHMAQDLDGDGEFDNYFHMKVLTINGVIGSDKAAYRTINGSSNLSGLSSLSDENMAIIDKASATKKYQAHLTYWFAHAPKQVTFTNLSDGGGARVAVTGIGALRTPSGRRAATADGYIAPGTKVIDPLTGKVVDPYAKIDLD